MRFASLLLAILLCPCLTVAQVPAASASLTGTLTDPSGAAVAEADISARPIGGGASEVFTTRSGPDGRFELRLPPGRYRVTARHPSLARAEQEFTLSAGQSREWNLRLQLEPLAATVVVTADAEPLPAVNASAPVSIVTRQEIEQRQQVWLAPLLAELPGISTAQLGPNGGVTSLFLDGGNSNFTKVLIDGAPVNQPGGAVEFSNYTLENVEKIEVVHGASSSLFGSDAVSGVVQIFTRRGETRRPELSLESEGGGHSTWHASGALRGLLDRFDYSASLASFVTDGQGANDRFRDNTVSGNFGWRFSDTDGIRLALRNSSSDAGFRSEVENGSFGGPHARRNNQAGYLEARAQLRRRLTAVAGGRAEANAVFGTRVIPRAGVSYVARFGKGFWGATRVRASYGLGIKEPDMSETECNAELRPERSRTVNVGAEQLLAADQLRVSADYFNNRYTDVVSFIFAPATPNCPFGTFFNTDAARAFGGHATVEAHPLRWLRLSSQYTYDDTRVLRSSNSFADPTLVPGNRLLLRPLHAAHLAAQASFRRAEGSLTANFVGRRTDNDFFFFPTRFTSVAGYTRVDLAAGFSLDRGVKAVGQIENLLNRRYQEALGYPALRLTFRAGLKWRWGGE